MKHLLILSTLLISTICPAATLEITKTPDTLPRNIAQGEYSPMIELAFEGLASEQHILKIWLLSRGSWHCASSPWCESTYVIENSSGLTPDGKIQIVEDIDIYDYASLDIVARLYNASASEVAWDEHYISGVSNRPPVLNSIPDQHIAAGETVSFQAAGNDPDGDSVSYSASNLPDGATITQEGLFIWSPESQGEQTIIVHADDGQTYDSQKVKINVSPMEIPEILSVNYPECGSTGHLTGVVSEVGNYEDYAIITYIFIDGYGWVIKPTFEAPKTPIQADGTFEVNINTGGLDDLSQIVYVGVCRQDAEIPTVAGGDLPEDIPALTSLKQSRDISSCHRLIEWSGHTWWVKTSRGGTLGPGSNVFSDSSQAVFVDADNHLHLKIINVDGVWQCSEIVSLETFGYGLYEFELEQGPVLDKNAVFGFFTWENDVPEEYNREIDIEFSQWGIDDGINSQYVVQPWQDDANIFKFNFPINEDGSIHRFYWQPDLIKFQSIFCSNESETSGNIMTEWLYAGGNIPTTSKENLRLNFWIIDGETAPSNGQEQEIIIKSFKYRYSDDLTGDIDTDGDIDGQDLFFFSSAYGLDETHPDYNSAADVYPDGKIDEHDLGLFVEYFGDGPQITDN